MVILRFLESAVEMGFAEKYKLYCRYRDVKFSAAVRGSVAWFVVVWYGTGWWWKSDWLVDVVKIHREMSAN